MKLKRFIQKHSKIICIVGGILTALSLIASFGGVVLPTPIVSVTGILVFGIGLTIFLLGLCFGKNKYVKYVNDDFFKDGFDDNVETHINDYFANEKLCTICKNYVKKTENLPSLFHLELSIIPYEYIKKTGRFVITKNKSKNKSLYNDIISKYDDDMLEKEFWIAGLIHQIKNRDYITTQIKMHEFNKNRMYLFAVYSKSEIKKLDKEEEQEIESIVNEFKPIDNLYQACINKGIIKQPDTTNKYTAFLFLIYYYNKLSFVNAHINMLDSYSLSIEDSDDKIIKPYLKVIAKNI